MTNDNDPEKLIYHFNNFLDRKTKSMCIGSKEDWLSLEKAINELVKDMEVKPTFVFVPGVGTFDIEPEEIFKN